MSGYNVFSSVNYGGNQVVCKEIQSLYGLTGKLEGIRYIEYAQAYREYDMYSVPVGCNGAIKPDTGTIVEGVFVPNFDALATGNIFYGEKHFVFIMDGKDWNAPPPLDPIDFNPSPSMDPPDWTRERRSVIFDGQTYAVEDAQLLFVRISALMAALGVTDILDNYRRT